MSKREHENAESLNGVSLVSKDVLEMSDTSSLQQQADEHPTIQDVQPREQYTQPRRLNPRLMGNSVLISADMISISVVYTPWTNRKTLYLLLQLHVCLH